MGVGRRGPERGRGQAATRPAWTAWGVGLLLAVAIATGGAAAQDFDIEVPGTPPPVAPTSDATLFRDVRIFDGSSPTLSAPSNLLVVGNLIERISVEPSRSRPGRPR